MSEPHRQNTISTISTFRLFKGAQFIREECLKLSVIKLGKLSSADLKLDDAMVSRMHAIIEVNGPGNVTISDLGSLKGTFVNDQKISRAKLQSGDTILIGETRIEFNVSEVLSSRPRPTVDWKSLLKERFTSKGGQIEELHILQGPTYPCQFYVGPILEWFSIYTNSVEYVPRFNDPQFYHRTQEEALDEILRMRAGLET